MNEPFDLEREIEAISPSSLVEAMDRERPYSGQPHTDHGERGTTLVSGLTFRDVRDCFIRACYDASGLRPEEYPGSVHDLPWEQIDVIAVQQNMSCWMERYMGIYPNVPPLMPADPKSNDSQGAAMANDPTMPYLGDTVRRTDEDWGDGELIGVMVHDDLSVDYRIKWPDVVAWVPEGAVELVDRKSNDSPAGDPS